MNLPRLSSLSTKRCQVRLRGRNKSRVGLKGTQPAGNSESYPVMDGAASRGYNADDSAGVGSRERITRGVGGNTRSACGGENTWRPHAMAEGRPGDGDGDSAGRKYIFVGMDEVLAEYRRLTSGQMPPAVP